MVDYVVVGAGAIGGTVGARLVRDGYQVLFSDADAEHVAAINAAGLTIEGPVEQFTVRARGVLPDELPDRLDTARVTTHAITSSSPSSEATGTTAAAATSG